VFCPEVFCPDEMFCRDATLAADTADPRPFTAQWRRVPNKPVIFPAGRISLDGARY
jgi:hypothetical protein